MKFDSKIEEVIYKVEQMKLKGISNDTIIQYVENIGLSEKDSNEIITNITIKDGYDFEFDCAKDRMYQPMNLEYKDNNFVSVYDIERDYFLGWRKNNEDNILELKFPTSIEYDFDINTGILYVKNRRTDMKNLKNVPQDVLNFIQSSEVLPKSAYAMPNYAWYDDIRPPWYKFRNFIKEVVISEGVINIGAGSFCDCENLVSVILPKSLEVICEGAFISCSSLKEITIPKNVKLIGKYAFKGCSELNYVRISRNTIIHNDATFNECPNIQMSFYE